MNAAPEPGKTWQECLEQVMSGPGHKPDYRALCADDHPQHEVWRARMCAKLGMPSLATQAVNLAGAVGRVIRAAAQGEPLKVPADVHAVRLEACLACPHNGKAEAGDVHCRLCGCRALKLQLATERCPDKPSRWDRWSPAEASAE